MASDLNFVEYVRDQINAAGQVSFKKMFGEYAIYYDEKVVALVCDNQLFIKPTVGGRSMIGSIVEAPPYPGAKPHFLIGEQLDDQHWMSSLIQLTASELPAPKPKKPKPKKAKI
jgi:DNA transformation protein and related proteins